MQARLIAQSLTPAVIAIIFSIFIGFVVYFWFVYKKQNEVIKKENNVLTDYENILTQAHEKARTIITDASKKAQDLLNKMSVTSTTQTQAIDKKLAEETMQVLSYYNKTLQAVEQQTYTTMQKTKEEMTNLATNELNSYRSDIAKDTMDIKKQISTQAQDALAKMDEEVQAYKQQRVNEIDQKVAQMIQKLALDLLGKSLSLDDHEQLIKKAIQQAKQEGFLTV